MADIRDYIVMHYNEKRLHSYLNYASPNEYERQFNLLPESVTP
jgi:putative transposase